MKEYIERKKLMTFLDEQLEKETGAFSKGFNKGINVARSIVNNKEINPTADVAEVRHAHWRKIKSGYWCSNCCLVEKDLKQEYNYCPNCGAKMDGRTENNDHYDRIKAMSVEELTEFLCDNFDCDTCPAIDGNYCPNGNLIICSKAMKKWLKSEVSE